MKNLPHLFKGNAPKSNNQEISVLNKNIEDTKENSNINNQIKDIFLSDKFLYKANVRITLNNNEVIEKTIIGKTTDSLITIDDELISVDSISKLELL